MGLVEYPPAALLLLLLLTCAPSANRQGRTEHTRQPQDGQHTQVARPAQHAQAGAPGLPTGQGASRRPRGLLRQYNLERAWGSSGSHIVIYASPGAATQSTGTGCIACVHPTQVHAFYRQGVLPRRALSFPPPPYTPTQYLGLVGGGPDQPTDRLGGPGLELYYGVRGGIFIAGVTSIPSTQFTTARQSGAAAALCSASALSHPHFLARSPTPLLPSRPSAEQAFLPPLPCDFFFCLHPGGPSPAAAHLLPGHPSSHPHSHLSGKQFQILDWSPLYLLGYYLVPSIRSRPSTLDPRDLVTPSIKSRCCPPGHANPSDRPSFKIPTNLTRVAFSFDGHPTHFRELQVNLGSL